MQPGVDKGEQKEQKGIPDDGVLEEIGVGLRDSCRSSKGEDVVLFERQVKVF